MWMPTDTYMLHATLFMGKKPRAFREKALQDQEHYGGLCIRASVVPGYNSGDDVTIVVMSQ